MRRILLLGGRTPTQRVIWWIIAACSILELFCSFSIIRALLLGTSPIVPIVVGFVCMGTCEVSKRVYERMHVR